MSTTKTSFDVRSSAMLSIDLQLYDIEPSVGLLSKEPKAIVDAFLKHMQSVVIANVARLQSACRTTGVEVLHTRILSMTSDGRDRSKGHKALGLHIAPSDPMGQFIAGVNPIDDEMVFNKTASGVFNSTNLDYVLRNLAIETIIVCGVYTDECVSNAIRTGCDLGYQMILVSDACAAVRPERHLNVVEQLDQRYCQVMGTHEIIGLIAK